MKLYSAYLWEKGAGERNQDSIVLLQTECRRGRVSTVCICDGIGGLSEGEMASGFAAEMVSLWFYKEFLPMAEKKKGKGVIRKSLQRLFHEIHEEIKGYGEKKGIKLGTTMTLLATIERSFYLFHVGDSGAYKIKRKVKKLTTEDGRGRVLYRCIGAGKWKNPERKSGRIYGKTIFLLCSDGFYTNLSKEEIKAVCAPCSFEERTLEKYLAEAGKQIRQRGGRDDISAVVVVCKP